MDVRVGLLVLLVLAGNWVSDARKSAALEASGVEDTGKNINVCSLCEEYSTLALEYLSGKETQKVVMEALHDACSGMRSLADQCTSVVDEYAQLFFSEVSSFQPKEVCKSVGLCRNAMIFSVPAKADKCMICQQAVKEVLVKLKDPETELDIIERLLKACSTTGKFQSKCKEAVFEFGPMIFVDAGSFLEKLDICTTFGACTKHNVATEELMPAEGKIEMVTSA